MLNFFGPQRTYRGSVSRRDVLRIGGLAAAGLALPDVLRLQAEEAPRLSRPANAKSVILIWMRGAPSHIDSFDMKPDAPLEIRGEFEPIDTNVPGIQICEHLPLTATLADKFAIIRGIKSNDLGDHTPHYILTGSPDRGKRPAFGAVVSHLQPRTDCLPPYVSLMYKPPGLYDNEGPLYLGSSHRPFVPRAEGLENLSLVKGMSLDRLSNRKQLLNEFDALERLAEAQETMSAIDSFNQRALEMVKSPQIRAAFDLKQESEQTRERYGKFCENFLYARRLAEAGIPVITLKVGDWDTHEQNFIEMRQQLPQLDRGYHALITDLYDRGLQDDVAVVMWGEFGRTPRVYPMPRGAGRDHWPEAGMAVIAGGGFKTGQLISETDSQGARAKGRPYTPANVLANMYHHLGIDPTRVLLDANRRPIPVLDDAHVVQELV